MPLSDMRDKLDGLRLTFRLSKTHTELVERARITAKVSTVSEFIRRAVLNEAERVLHEDEIQRARRAAQKAQITGEYPVPDDLKLRLVGEDAVSYGAAKVLPPVPKPPATG